MQGFNQSDLQQLNLTATISVSKLGTLSGWSVLQVKKIKF
jgi:hypothetical protein